MGHFFLALGIIVCGGVLPLFLWRQFTLMRVVAVAVMAAGCLLGIGNAVSVLFSSQIPAVTVSYLNVLNLAFRIDALSAFFLVAIFGVAFLAVVYSYHYMDHAQQSGRTAVHYLFFGLLITSMTAVVTAANLITFLLSWEIMSLSSFFLVVYNYEAVENRKAGYLYFVFSQVGALFIFAAFAIIFAHDAGFSFQEAAALSQTTKIVVFALAFVGFGSKAGDLSVSCLASPRPSGGVQPYLRRDVRRHDQMRHLRYCTHVCHLGLAYAHLRLYRAYRRYG